MTNTEINEAVARKLGWTQIKCGDTHCFGPMSMRWRSVDGRHFDTFPAYSTSIEAAWEIVESLKMDFCLSRNGHWDCQFGPNGLGQPGLIDAVADTAPMAICLAFLKLR